MRQDKRLSRVLHALLHLDGMDEPATSDLIAQMLQTNSAVVRRTMAGLRDAEIVTSTKGHGGGWILIKPLSEVTLLAIYRALGSPTLFALGNDEDEPTCLLAREANAATTEALNAARSQFERSLGAVTVAQLTAGWRQDMANCNAASQVFSDRLSPSRVSARNPAWSEYSQSQISWRSKPESVFTRCGAVKHTMAGAFLPSAGELLVRFPIPLETSSGILCDVRFWSLASW